MTGEDRPSAELMWKFILTVASAVVLAVGGALIMHEVRLGRIDANRFTDAEAVEMERRIRENTPEAPRINDILRRLEAGGL